MDLQLRRNDNTRPLFAFSNVMSDIRWRTMRKIFSPGSALLSEKSHIKSDPFNVAEDKWRNAESEIELSQRLHFLYRSFYVNMKNQHFFLLIMLLPGVFYRNDTFLFVHHECMLTNVLQQTVFVSLLWEKICSETKQRPSPTDLTCNHFTWIWPARIPKCLLTQMKRDALPNVGKGSCDSIL